MAELAKTVGWVSLAAGAGSVVNLGSDQEWYSALDKPGFTPPPAAFPLAWTLLYADLALASAHVLTRLPQGSAQRRRYQRALLANLTFNATWSWTFFRARRLGLATAHAGLLALSSTDLACRAARVSRCAGAGHAAYAGWCGFALVLADSIRRRNA